MSDSYEYVSGENQQSCFQVVQIFCGNLVGCCKAWVPCIGCFLCCNHPYQIIEQGNKGLLTRYKRYVKTVQPGLIYVNPVTEQLIPVDCRITVIDLPKQKLMTKDNISITIDSCVYYHIREAHIAIYRIQNIDEIIIKACGGIIKNTTAQFTFQELLQKRQHIANDIQEQIKPIIQHWGLEINQIYLKDFLISAELEKQLVSAPIARRNAESKIISAQGDVEVARMLSNRSKILDTKTAIQVRYLQALKSLGRNQKSTLIYTSY